MSVKHSLLAMLLDGPRYGASLRAEFEARTANTWPLNVGQVYTTLGRLERDGLVVSAGSTGSDDTTISYALTDGGRDEVTNWWHSPVDRSAPSRDELAIKFALAVTAPGVDVASIVQRQRSATLTRLQRLTRTKRSLPAGPDDIPGLLVLEHLIFSTEAESRWLDHIEPIMTRSQRTTSTHTPGANTDTDTDTAGEVQ